MNKTTYTIDEIKKIIEPVVIKYGVKRLAVFGSYARGNATHKSDIDFHLLDTDNLWGYFTLCGFRQDLEEHLGIGVDVLTTGAMDQEILNSIQKDEVLLFEQ